MYEVGFWELQFTIWRFLIPDLLGDKDSLVKVQGSGNKLAGLKLEDTRAGREYVESSLRITIEEGVENIGITQVTLVVL
jgi:hypothetical protein